MTKTFEEVAQSELEQANNIYEAYQGRFKSEIPDGGLVVRIGDQILRFPWLEFAKNWHSDEEYQELLSKYSGLNDNYEKEVIRTSKLIAEGTGLLSDNAMLTKKAEDLKSQLEQQPLPEVPEYVAEFVSGDETELSKADRIAYLLKSVETDNYYLEEYLTNAGIISQDQGEHLYAWVTNQTHETILKLWNGYQVEKPQLFYIELPNVYGLKNKIFVSKVENGTIVEFSNGKNYALKFTEQEIKSIDERYWQFAVPVEDRE